jgi:hypothetical protein
MRDIIYSIVDIIEPALNWVLDLIENISLDLKYKFVMPFKHRHKHFKAGELVMVHHNWKERFGIIVDGPFDRYDRRLDWDKRRVVKNCLYQVFMVDEQKYHRFHYGYFERME